ALEQAIGTAIEVVRRHNVVAGRQRLEQCVGGSKPRREADPVPPALEGSQVALERESGRVVGAGVLVALVPPERLLGVGRGLIDRHHNGAGGGIGLLAGVDCPGAEPRALRERGVAAHHSLAAMNWSMSKRVRMPTTEPLSRTSTAGLRLASSCVTR